MPLSMTLRVTALQNRVCPALENGGGVFLLNACSGQLQRVVNVLCSIH